VESALPSLAHDLILTEDPILAKSDTDIEELNRIKDRMLKAEPPAVTASRIEVVLSSFVLPKTDILDPKHATRLTERVDPISHQDVTEQLDPICKNDLTLQVLPTVASARTDDVEPSRMQPISDMPLPSLDDRRTEILDPTLH
jgi:hypothetical protein